MHFSVPKWFLFPLWLKLIPMALATSKKPIYPEYPPNRSDVTLSIGNNSKLSTEEHSALNTVYVGF